MNYSTTQVPFILAALIAVIFNAVIVEPMSHDKQNVEALRGEGVSIKQAKLEPVVKKEISIPTAK